MTIHITDEDDALVLARVDSLDVGDTVVWDAILNTTWNSHIAKKITYCQVLYKTIVKIKRYGDQVYMKLDDNSEQTFSDVAEFMVLG